MKAKITNKMIAEKIYDKRKHGSGKDSKFTYSCDGDHIRVGYYALCLGSPVYRKSHYIAPTRIDKVLDILNEMREENK